MKHIIIRNLGPVVEADIELKRINVILGPQSSGKSCVLKTVCHCTWVEKRIQIEQSADYFKKNGNFIKGFIEFHNLYEYIKPNTYISYESDFMRFSYDGVKSEFDFQWKDGRWNYNRPKITYMPAERNMVAVIPNWLEVKLDDCNMLIFMGDWDVSRKATEGKLEVLNLGVKYQYDSHSGRDLIVVDSDEKIDFRCASSGLHSLVPLIVILNYLNKIRYERAEQTSVASIQEVELLYKKIYKEFFAERVADLDDANHVLFGGIGHSPFPFSTSDDEEEFVSICNRYAQNNFCDVFLEEPEENLFPPTQAVLVDWLLGMTASEHPCNLFVATHSPYVLTSFLERTDLDFGLFLTPFSEGGKVVVKTASEEEIQQVYDYGIDAFFNIGFFE